MGNHVEGCVILLQGKKQINSKNNITVYRLDHKFSPLSFLHEKYYSLFLQRVTPKRFNQSRHEGQSLKSHDSLCIMS